MSSIQNKIRKSSIQLLIYVTILFVLLLTSNNIYTFLSYKNVLGAETKTVDPFDVHQMDKEKVFWNDFLEKNPNYIPGWIEVERSDMTNNIDPNYEVR